MVLCLYREIHFVSFFVCSLSRTEGTHLRDAPEGEDGIISSRSTCTNRAHNSIAPSIPFVLMGCTWS